MGDRRAGQLGPPRPARIGRARNMAGKRLVAGCRPSGSPGPQGPGSPWPGAGPSGSPGPYRPGSPWRDNDPEEILSHRYAAGEIDAEEYRQRLEVLRAQRHAVGAGSA